MHLQNLNTRARGDKTYHLVVSFPPGERPSPDQLHVIEGELIGAIGLGEHQRMSAVHTDTEHLRIHIALNKVSRMRRSGDRKTFRRRNVVTAWRIRHPSVWLDCFCRRHDARPLRPRP